MGLEVLVLGGGKVFLVSSSFSESMKKHGFQISAPKTAENMYSKHNHSQAEAWEFKTKFRSFISHNPTMANASACFGPGHLGVCLDEVARHFYTCAIWDQLLHMTKHPSTQHALNEGLCCNASYKNMPRK